CPAPDRSTPPVPFRRRRGDRYRSTKPARTADGRSLVPRPMIHPSTCYAEATTRPTHSPKPMRTAPSPSHQALSVISSPSSRKLRFSPLGSSIGALPPWLISRSEPRPVLASVDRVPVPMRSPGWRLQPLLLWWATICAALQYIAASAEPRER